MPRQIVSENEIDEDLEDFDEKPRTKGKKAKNVENINEKNRNVLAQRIDILYQKQNNCAYLQALNLSHIAEDCFCNICHRPALYKVNFIKKEGFSLNDIYLCKEHKDIAFTCKNEQVPYYFAPCTYFKTRADCDYFSIEVSKEVVPPTDLPESAIKPTSWDLRCACHQLIELPLKIANFNPKIACSICGQSPAISLRLPHIAHELNICKKHANMQFLCGSREIALQPAPCAILTNCENCMHFLEGE